MKAFHLNIAKVGESLFEGEAHSLTVTCIDGQVTILAEHEPYVSSVVPCTAIVYDAKEHRHDIPLGEPGVLEVSNNQATVLL